MPLSSKLLRSFGDDWFFISALDRLSESAKIDEDLPGFGGAPAESKLADSLLLFQKLSVTPSLTVGAMTCLIFRCLEVDRFDRADLQAPADDE